MSRSFATLRAVAVAALSLAAVSARAQSDICLPTIGGLAGTPVIDGIVDGYTGPGVITNDAGWNQATRWNLSGDHGATTATKFQAGYAGGFLYLSYVVDTPSYGQDNTIVIGFANTGAAASTDWRIFIQPSNVAPPPDGDTIAPFSVSYYRDSANDFHNSALQNANGQWPMNNTKFSKAGNRWAVEINIPVTTNVANAAQNTAVYLPASGAFRFYTAVFSTYTFQDVTVVQDPFPATAFAGTGDILAKVTPAVSQWGQMSLNSRPACTGVSLAWNHVGVEFPANTGTIVSDIKRFNGAIPEANIAACNALVENGASVGPDNTFLAQPANPSAAPGTNVFATFRLANWGIPAPQEFDKLGSPSFSGVSSNPTAQANVGIGGADLRAHWALTYKQSCQYKFQSHQCIQVDLDSNDPAVRFLNKSVQRNMNFVPASVFKQDAHVSGNWARLAGREKDSYPVAILVDTDQQLTKGAVGPTEARKRCDPGFRSDELRGATAGMAKVAQFAWIARGILLRDDVIIINNTKYRVGTRVGDFGYVTSHLGPFTSWRATFTGAGLKPAPKNPGVYLLDVKRDGADVTTVIEAVGGKPNRETPYTPPGGLSGDAQPYRPDQPK
jgi:hypothetical protein